MGSKIRLMGIALTAINQQLSGTDYRLGVVVVDGETMIVVDQYRSGGVWVNYGTYETLELALDAICGYERVEIETACSYGISFSSQEAQSVYL